jgi:hypothetical protein
MKRTRLTTVLFALLTLVALWPAHAFAAEGSTAGSATVAPTTVPVGAVNGSTELSCNLGPVIATELPGSNPTPEWKLELCGACSEATCRGFSVGSRCLGSGEPSWCVANRACSSAQRECLCVPIF